MKRYAIGVDLGATHLRVVLANRRGKFLARVAERTVRRGGRLAVARQILRLVRAVTSHVDMARVRGLGIGSTGPLDPRRGSVLGTPNLPFKEILLARPLTAELGLPLYLANDCTAAVWGEREFGAGRGVANLVYITLSTGIGGGAIVDGHLLLGKDGNAVEIGHVTLDFAGIRCGCGKPGHWEAYCSASNIPRFVRLWLQARRRGVRESLLFKLTGGKLSRLTTQLLFEAAQAGDKLSCEIVQELGLLNAIGFANVINAYDPELITVGGAMALNNPQLILDPIRRYVRGYVINRTPRIRITPLGHDITLYGATALVFNPPPGLTRW